MRRTNHIKLTPYPNGHGVKIEIDGQEILEVGDITFHAPVDGYPTLALTVFAQHPEIEVEAVVTLNMQVGGRCDGCKHWDKDTVAEERGECLLQLTGSHAKMLSPASRAAIITEGDFGCVQFKAK